MSVAYGKHFSTKETPQSMPIPGSSQIPNSAGGYSFGIDDWSRLDRFLILGAEGGSYYASEQKLTIENAKAVQRCLAEDGLRVVRRTVEISKEGRAPKNDPAIFVLAMASAVKNDAVKKAAYAAVPEICRIGTHIYQFAEAVQNFRGWGRGLRNAIGKWYTSKEPSDLAYQLIKYQQRNGWSHRDLLRLSHPKAAGVTQELLYWATKGWDSVGKEPHSLKTLQIVWAFERAKKATDKKEVVKLIRDYNLPRECIPTNFLTEASVWEALLEKMPMTAMIRNLATMTRVGLLAPMSNAVKKVVGELEDEERLHKSRIHPIGILSALKTYEQGHGERGSNTWTPISQVVDALDGAFYKTFKNVEPTGKRWYLGIDVSGSMWGTNVAGVVGLNCGIAAAAMALVTARVEESWYMAAFDTTMHPFAPSPRQRLDDLAKVMQRLPWGGTDCSLPMLDALSKKIPVDVFVIYTDSETWAGHVHPPQALKQYRDKMGINAKLIVVGMCSNNFTIADPNDVGMLDVVGFDTSTPQVMSEFAKG